jgi:hypothetical protein
VGAGFCAIAEDARSMSGRPAPTRRASFDIDRIKNLASGNVA